MGGRRLPSRLGFGNRGDLTRSLMRSIVEDIECSIERTSKAHEVTGTSCRRDIRTPVTGVEVSDMQERTIPKSLSPLFSW